MQSVGDPGEEGVVVGLNRRAVFGLGSAAAASVALGSTAAGTARAAARSPVTAPLRIALTYQQETAKAGGDWYSYITLATEGGSLEPVVVEQPDELVFGYSVNKIAVATAVLDKIDRGELALDQTVTLTADIIDPPGDGIYRLHSVYGDQLTLAGVMSAMLLVSDDSAVRLCAQVCSAAEVNEIIAAKGFPQTQVTPRPDRPPRFFLGTTTPRQTHELLRALVGGTLLSERSTEFLLTILRWKDGYHDGIRRTMSSDERLRVATKYGAFDDGRNEAGVMFDPGGVPALIYSIFAAGQADPDNFGATHPAVQARAVLGRVMFDEMPTQPAPDTRIRFPSTAYTPVEGG